MKRMTALSAITITWLELFKEWLIITVTWTVNKLILCQSFCITCGTSTPTFYVKVWENSKILIWRVSLRPQRGMSVFLWESCDLSIVFNFSHRPWKFGHWSCQRRDRCLSAFSYRIDLQTTGRITFAEGCVSLRLHGRWVEIRGNKTTSQRSILFLDQAGGKFWRRLCACAECVWKVPTQNNRGVPRPAFKNGRLTPLWRDWSLSMRLHGSI